MTVSKMIGISEPCQVPASLDMAVSGKTPMYRYRQIGMFADTEALARTPAGHVNSWRSKSVQKASEKVTPESANSVRKRPAS